MNNKEYNLSVDYIKSIIGDFCPKVGVILGSGLGNFADSIDIKFSLDYKSIPNFPVSTVEGHDGLLIFGYVENVPIVIMKGRFHYYEGYSSQMVVYPIRVMKLLGIDSLYVSNACGGINKDFEVGDLVIIKNHICLIPNPLIGANDSDFGVRFPEMKQPYSSRLIDAAKQIEPLKEGVYVAVTGPSLETAAEINFYKVIGGDMIGMSTAPEAIAGVHCGLEVFGMSVITNSTYTQTTHEQVVEQGNKASQKMSLLFKKLIVATNN